MHAWHASVTECAAPPTSRATKGQQFIMPAPRLATSHSEASQLLYCPTGQVTWTQVALALLGCGLGRQMQAEVGSVRVQAPSLQVCTYISYVIMNSYIFIYYIVSI